MNRPNRLLTFVTLTMLALLPSLARAGVIIGPTSVSSNVPDFSPNFDIGNLINQSGILAAYTSGVTDFDAFIGSTTLTNNPSADDQTGWASTIDNNFPVTIDFDLGSVFNVSRMALWNDTDVQALGAFELFSSTDASFSTLTSLGAFTGSVMSIGDLAQVFDFADSSTQYIRVLGSPVVDVNGLLNIGEFAFEGVVSVSEPSALLLFSVCLAGLGWSRRKKN